MDVAVSPTIATHANARDHEYMRNAERELARELERQIDQRATIHAHLKREISMQEERLVVLTAQNQELLKSLKLQQEQNAAKIDELSIQNDAELNRLRSKLANLESNIAQQASVALEKQELQSKLEFLVNNLEVERKNNMQQISELERRNVIKKEQLRIKMVAKLRSYKQDLLSQTDQHLDNMTRKILQEHTAQRYKLSVQSETVQSLLKRHDSMETLNRELKREIELCLCSYDILEKRAMKLQHTVQSWRQKLPQIKPLKQTLPQLPTVLQPINTSLLSADRAVVTVHSSRSVKSDISENRRRNVTIRSAREEKEQDLIKRHHDDEESAAQERVRWKSRESEMLHDLHLIEKNCAALKLELETLELEVYASEKLHVSKPTRAISPAEDATVSFLQQCIFDESRRLSNITYWVSNGAEGCTQANEQPSTSVMQKLIDFIQSSDVVFYSDNVNHGWAKAL